LLLARGLPCSLVLACLILHCSPVLPCIGLALALPCSLILSGCGLALALPCSLILLCICLARLKGVSAGGAPVPVGHIPVGIGCATTMLWIVLPGGISAGVHPVARGDNPRRPGLDAVHNESP